jgi:ribonuclease P protein component
VDFRSVVRSGRRASSRLVVVHLTTDQPSASTRVGFVVSRAVGPAVVRNRVKRRLRHLMRDRLGDVPPGAMMVVRANPAARTASYGEVARDLDRCLATVKDGSR